MYFLAIFLLTLAQLHKGCADLSFSGFPNSYVVNSSPAYTVYWKLNATSIIFGVDVSAKNKWIGLGIAEPSAGSMGGADMAILQVSSGSLSLGDYHALGKFTPILDDCQSWILEQQSITASGKAQAIFSRKLNTSDPQDRPVITSSGYNTKMIWAIGSSPSLSYHQLRGTFGLYLNGGSPGQVNSSWLEWNITMPGFAIPSAETTYGCYALSLPQDQTYYIKRFQFVNSNTLSQAQVHHLLIYSCENVSGGDYQYYDNNAANCFATNQACTELLYLWVPGENEMQMPQDVSFEMGASGTKHVLIQIHYTNPTGVSNEVDFSGVKIFYDTVPTKHLAGVIVLGDPYIRGAPIPAGKSNYHLEYTCPSQCTQNLFSDPVTIWADVMHMHGRGSMIYSTITTATGSTSTLNRVEFYDYGFQIAVRMNKTLKAGDRVNTHCVFDTTGVTSPVPIGLGTHDEMCMEFVFYYPKVQHATECGFFADSGVNYTICGGQLQDVRNPSAIDSSNFLSKNFGKTGETSCQTPTPTETTKPSNKAAFAGKLDLGMFVAFLLSILLWL